MPKKATKKADRSLWPRPLSMHMNNAVWGVGAALFSGFTPESPQRYYAKKNLESAAEPPFEQWQDAIRQDPTLAARSAQDIILEMHKGIRAYQSFGAESLYPVREVIWQMGACSLKQGFDGELVPQGGASEPSDKRSTGRNSALHTPHYVVIIPSLVNGPQILDIREGVSFTEYLHERGLLPLYLDWGAPQDGDGAEIGFTIGDYIKWRLVPCLDDVLRRIPAHAQISFAGYCMGGTILAAYLGLVFGAGFHRPDIAARIKGAVFLAAPWNFHADPAHLAMMRLFAQHVDPKIEREGVLEGDWIQSIFACLDPTAIIRKFRGFHRMMEEGAQGAEHFVAVEDWLNSGPDLAGPAARTCLGEWYDRNETALGTWRVCGEVLDVAGIAVPSLCVIPCRDRLVPPASAKALADMLRDVTVQSPDCGHIGLMSGHHAKTDFWPDIADWLLR